MIGLPRDLTTKHEPIFRITCCLTNLSLRLHWRMLCLYISTAAALCCLCYAGFIFTHHLQPNQPREQWYKLDHVSTGEIRLVLTLLVDGAAPAAASSIDATKAPIKTITGVRLPPMSSALLFCPGVIVSLIEPAGGPPAGVAIQVQHSAQASSTTLLCARWRNAHVVCQAQCATALPCGGHLNSPQDITPLNKIALGAVKVMPAGSTDLLLSGTKSGAPYLKTKKKKPLRQVLMPMP